MLCESYCNFCIIVSTDGEASLNSSKEVEWIFLVITWCPNNPNFFELLYIEDHCLSQAWTMHCFPFMPGRSWDVRPRSTVDLVPDQEVMSIMHGMDTCENKASLVQSQSMYYLWDVDLRVAESITELRDLWRTCKWRRWRGAMLLWWRWNSKCGPFLSKGPFHILCVFCIVNEGVACV